MCTREIFDEEDSAPGRSEGETQCTRKGGLGVRQTERENTRTSEETKHILLCMTQRASQIYCVLRKLLMRLQPKLGSQGRRYPSVADVVCKPYSCLFAIETLV
jgi:hypothetical protein